MFISLDYFPVFVWMISNAEKQEVTGARAAVNSHVFNLWYILITYKINNCKIDQIDVGVIWFQRVPDSLGICYLANDTT